MPSMPREPEAFAEHVASLLKRMQPDFSVELIGPRELIINGRRLDLENLYRMVNHEPASAIRFAVHAAPMVLVPSPPCMSGYFRSPGKSCACAQS